MLLWNELLHTTAPLLSLAAAHLSQEAYPSGLAGSASVTGIFQPVQAYVKHLNNTFCLPVYTCGHVTIRTCCILPYASYSC